MSSSTGPSAPRVFEESFVAAMQLAETSRTEQAATAFAELVRIAPRDVRSRQMLAAVLLELGRHAQALRELDAVIMLSPKIARVHGLRCEALLALERAEEAAAAATTALEIDAHSRVSRMGLARALLGCGRWRQAADMFTDMLVVQPERLDVRCALVRARLHNGEPEVALAAARHPALLDARPALDAVVADFAAADAMPQYAALLEARLERAPRDYDAALALAAASHGLGRTGAALRWSGLAHALRPSEHAARAIHATALIDRGDVQSGLATYRDVMADGDSTLLARHLILMHYDPAQDNASLFAAHRDFVEHHLRANGPPFPTPSSTLDAGRKLRVGWMSPRVCAGPVATFLGGLLGHFDRTHHHHLLIDLAPSRDASAQRLYALADETIDAGGLNDARLLERLRNLDLDVLIDLAGHSTGNRLAVLAERVAPLQLCWLDYFDTTALPAMDAWITDRWLTPLDSTQRYSERVVRLDAGRFCYTPIEDSPLPQRVHGIAVVFASFNRLAKFNDEVIAAWAAILHLVPGARLDLRTRLLGDADNRAYLGARFAAHGIGAERLHLHGELAYTDLLAAYQHVDIALDPFPFSGCTTTCDALWMGCPTITLPGETFVSRQSASLVQRVGRDEWIARDTTDYVERAVALGATVATLRADRAKLREAVEKRLCNADAQARDFATVLQELRCSHIR